MTPARPLTLHWLIDADRTLRLRCIECGRDRLMSGYEATHRYGHDLTFAELRALITGRCKARECRALIGPTVHGEAVVEANTKPFPVG